MRLGPGGERVWRAGDEHRIAGMNFRVVQGKKSPNDLRLDWLTDEGWVPVPMQVGFFFADFFYENEDTLREKYPHVVTFAGGEMYLRAIRVAGREGWDKAQAGLEAQQRSVFEDGVA